MEKLSTPRIALKISTLYKLLILSVVCGVALTFIDAYLSLSPARQIATVGILSPGLLILFGFWTYVSGTVTEVKPNTAYVVADPDEDHPLQDGKIIFDNHHDVTCFCWPLSGQKVNYSVRDIPLKIQANGITVEYQVGWNGSLVELFAMQRLAVRDSDKPNQEHLSLQQPPVSWFERWVRHKNGELERYINSLEDHTQSLTKSETEQKKREIEQKVALAYNRLYERFGLKLKFQP